MKVLLVGYERSGKAAHRLLKKMGYHVTVVADERQLDKSKIGRLLLGLSFVVVSPGVPLDCDLVLAAKNKNLPVIGEIEVAQKNMQGNIIGITGTNGKTTTTSLVYHLLKADNVFVGGNIGVPLSEFALSTNPQSTIVAELSSFQLESCSSFRPHIAVLLNVTPDHLNRHKTMQAYLSAKLNIFANQTPSDYAVLNADDPIVSTIVPKNSKVYYFSTKKRVNGCYLSGDNIYFRDTTNAVAGFARATIVAHKTDIHLLGEHNVSNCLAALTCAILSGADYKLLAEKLRTFLPVEHRLEYVTDVGGVRFINDSKATTPQSTVCAIQSMDRPTSLILGGSDKGCLFDDIFKVEPNLITNYILMGQTRAKLYQTAMQWGKKNVYLCDDLSCAVELAYKLSSSGNNVLFSPACASYDMFSNYEERGKCFCGIVRGLKKSEDNRLDDNQKTKV